MLNIFKQHNKDMLNIFMHQTIIKINGRRKGRSNTEYLLHECAFLKKEYFRIQRSLFTFWSLKYFTYKKEVPKEKASKTSLM